MLSSLSRVFGLLAIIGIVLVVPAYGESQTFKDPMNLIEARYGFDKSSPPLTYESGETGYVNITVNVIGDKKIRVTSYGASFDWDHQERSVLTTELGPDASLDLPPINFEAPSEKSAGSFPHNFRLFVNFDYFKPLFSFLGVEIGGDWKPTKAETKELALVVQGLELPQDKLLHQIIARLDSLSNTIGVISGKIDKAREAVSNVNSALIQLNATDAELLAKMESLEDDLRAQSESLSSLRNRLNSALQIELDETQLNKLSQEISSEIRELASRLDNVEERISGADTDITTLAHKVTTLNSTISNVKKTVNEINQTFWIVVLPLSIGLSLSVSLTFAMYFTRRRARRQQDR